MKLTIIGAGYVGLVSGVGYSSLGNEVTCIDVDENKVRMIAAGVPPIYEQGLEEALSKVLKEKKLSATTAYSSISSADLVFICVGTPSRSDGSIDLKYVESAAEQVGNELRNSEKFVSIVVRSTVIPGTALNVSKIIEGVSGKKHGRDFGIGMVPEFLKEGTALEDFMNPDRIVMGAEDEKTKELLEELHKGFNCPKIHTGSKTAEMVKYASNTFLLTKISFVNELANFCERIGVDAKEVTVAMGLDRRISPHFLNFGAGAGGSCFPKDVKAIMAFEKSMGFQPRILEVVWETNVKQPLRMTELAEAALGKGNLDGKKVCVLGLAFKADTDDMREAASIPIIKELQKRDCKIAAYDPKAMENAKKIFPDISYAASFEDALRGAEVCFIVTEWKEFKRPPPEFKRLMKSPIVIDGRRVLDPLEAKKTGLVYKGIGYGKK